MINQTPRTPAASPTPVVPLTIEQRKQLEDEYNQLCQDWRWRDKYVLDKLTGSGILFTLPALAIGNMQVYRAFMQI